MRGGAGERSAVGVRSDVTRRGVRNLATMTAGRGATQFVLIVSAFAIPRVLGVESYGRYSAIMAVIAIGIALSAFGLPTVASRYLSPLWMAGQSGQALALGSTLWLVRLTLSVVVGIGVGAWLLSTEELSIVLGLAAIIGLLSVFRYLFEAARSFMLPIGHPGKAAGFDFLRATATLILVVSVFPVAGLSGVFVALAAIGGVLAVGITAVLLAIFPLRLRAFSLPALRRHARYGLAAFLGTLSDMVQSQFSIYAVAVWVTRTEAGILAFTLQIHAFLRTFVGTAQLSLMPILSELESGEQRQRLRYWGGAMMRYGVALATLICVGWALTGGAIIRYLLTDSFAPAHRSGVVILLGLIFFTAASAANTLLYVRGLATLASLNSALHALITVGGLFLLRALGKETTALQVSWIYAVAAASYCASSLLSLGLKGRIWLPVRRSLLLMLPGLAAWPILDLEWGLPARLAAAALFLAVYPLLASRSGLLPSSEVRSIRRALRGGPKQEGSSGTPV